MDPLLGYGIKRFIEWWDKKRPMSPEARAYREVKRENRRRKRKGLEPLPLPPRQEAPVDKLKEFLAKYRTSTKAGAAGLIVPALVLLPFYDELNMKLGEICASGDGPLAAAVGMGVMWLSMYVTARRAKSPANPGIL